MSAPTTSRTPAVRFLYAGAAALLAICLALLAVALRPSWSDESVSLTGGSATDEVTLTVTRPRTGATGVDVRVTPREGGRDDAPAAVTVQAVMVTHGHATPQAPARPRGTSGTYSTSVHLMMPGRWTFRVSLDHGSRSEHVDFPVAISG
ncbi:hypothetical protein [Streptomyces olivaceus]|uniref:hypothetical protein n=1 Tax=Streptomyces olivaceus TaxID=47716 RepID=UPI0040570B59